MRAAIPCALAPLPLVATQRAPVTTALKEEMSAKKLRGDSHDPRLRGGSHDPRLESDSHEARLESELQGAASPPQKTGTTSIVMKELEGSPELTGYMAPVPHSAHVVSNSTEGPFAYTF